MMRAVLLCLLGLFSGCRADDFAPDRASSAALDQLADKFIDKLVGKVVDKLAHKTKLDALTENDFASERSKTLFAVEELSAAGPGWTALGPNTLMYLGYFWGGTIILGGCMGFAMARSKASLIAGSLCGILIGWATYEKSTEALMVLALVFTFSFGKKATKAGKVGHGLVFALLSLIVLIASAWSLHEAGGVTIDGEHIPMV
eukprot:gnl/MRDRNA2_/MRDRNA2_100086_c0_seq1.p1 gnl/MRDRNA2_/MRDRNA2_100086_c0~~gnl/MRDRNA2_/MRDRNA2_100086_c0_seq1.p1  ORF type:complete len:202 (+),score=43.78 gnl/MRDRNA2_/MRDRNA2_100086_c0_seq1:79-684(+)